MKPDLSMTFANGRLRGQDIKVAVLLPDKRVMEIDSPYSVELRQDNANPYNKIMTLKVTFSSYDLRTAEEILGLVDRPKTKPMHESRHCPWCKESIEELLTVVPNASNCCHCGGPLDEDTEEPSENTESDKESKLEGEKSSQGKQSSDSFNIDTLMAGMDKLKEAFSKIPPQKLPSIQVKAGEVTIIGANEIEYDGKAGIPRITLDKDGKQVFGSYNKD